MLYWNSKLCGVKLLNGFNISCKQYVHLCTVLKMFATVMLPAVMPFMERLYFCCCRGCQQLTVFMFKCSQIRLRWLTSSWLVVSCDNSWCYSIIIGDSCNHKYKPSKCCWAHYTSVWFVRVEKFHQLTNDVMMKTMF